MTTAYSGNGDEDATKERGVTIIMNKSIKYSLLAWNRVS